MSTVSFRPETLNDLSNDEHEVVGSWMFSSYCTACFVKVRAVPNEVSVAAVAPLACDTRIVRR